MVGDVFPARCATFVVVDGVIVVAFAIRSPIIVVIDYEYVSGDEHIAIRSPNTVRCCHGRRSMYPATSILPS